MMSSTNSPSQAHDAENHLAHGLRSELRERLLGVATMDRPLRIATAVTFAGLIAAAVSIAAREVKAPAVSLGTVDNVQVTLSAPLFAVALVLLCLGLGFVVASVLLATPVVASVGTVLLVALVGWATGVLGIAGLNVLLPGWARWVTRGLLAAMLLGGLVVLLIRRGRHGDAADDRRLRLVVLIVACVLFGGYFLVLWSASPTINGLTLFPQTVSLLMGDVALLATPLLMIASVDFGEWGKFGVERISRHRRASGDEPAAPRRRVVGSVVASVVAIVFGFVILRGSAGHRLWGFTEALMLLLAGIGLLLLGGRALRVSRFEWPKALSFAALFGVSATITWLVAAGAGAATGAYAVPPLPPVTAQGDYTSSANVQSVTGTTGFTALIPLGWTFTSDAASKLDYVKNTFPDGSAVLLAGFVASAGTTLAALETELTTTQVGGTSSDQGWTKASVQPQAGGSAFIWLRTESGGQERGFFGDATGANAATELAQLEAIVRTVRTSDQTPATLATVLAANGGLAVDDAQAQHRTDLIKAFGIGIELALTLAGLALFAIFGRRWSATWRTLVMVFATITVVTLLATVSALGRVLAGPAATWPVLTVGGLLAAAAVLAAVAIGIASRSRAAWADRLLAALPGMLGAIIALAAINELYDAALGAATVPAWAAILILAAVGWDIVASGETITNLASTTFPRSTRVLAYFGYILVLAAAMVFYSGQVSSATGRPVTDLFFEPEATTQSALFRIGFPLLLTLFLLQIASPKRQAVPHG
ncbi:hypothetical protein [Demequina lutea]|uniref:Uncharacterized protein n=1 Tax=Demequina lutea TaxID=431489 RepID=A0A7Y9ZBW6_9MICO|nr:hypothetical protein [Demequina lutea]NYI42522.1 hypothetical protein [Demequina lutea]